MTSTKLLRRRRIPVFTTLLNLPILKLHQKNKILNDIIKNCLNNTEYDIVIGMKIYSVINFLNFIGVSVSENNFITDYEFRTNK